MSYKFFIWDYLLFSSFIACKSQAILGMPLIFRYKKILPLPKVLSKNLYETILLLQKFKKNTRRKGRPHKTLSTKSCLPACWSCIMIDTKYKQPKVGKHKKINLCNISSKTMRVQHLSCVRSLK